MKCIYCGKKVGFLQWFHKDCLKLHNEKTNELGYNLELNLVSSFHAPTLTDWLLHHEGIINAGYIKEKHINKIIVKVISSLWENYESLDMQYIYNFILSCSDKIKEELLLHSSFSKHLISHITNMSSKNYFTEEEKHFIISLKSEGYINFSTVENVLLNQLNIMVNNALEDGVINDDELNSITTFISSSTLDLSERLHQHEGYQKLVQSQILTEIEQNVFNNHVEVSNLPILLGKNEVVLWAYNGVSTYLSKKGYEYVGKSQGVSVKICKGVYYRVGSSNGTKVAYDYDESLGTGNLIVTNKNIIFVGYQNVKIPIKKILTIIPHSNGIKIGKDGTYPKTYDFRGLDPWFIMNVCNMLY